VYNLSPQDLFFKYEAFLLSRPSGLRAKLSTFTLDVARELRKEIQRENQAKSLSNAATTPMGSEKVAGVRKKPGSAAADLGGFLDHLTTPVRKPKQAPTRLSNAGNNVNIQSPSAMLTPSRTPGNNATPTGPTASSYRPGAAGPSRAAPTAVTPIGKSAGPAGTDSPDV